MTQVINGYSERSSLRQSQLTLAVSGKYGAKKITNYRFAVCAKRLAAHAVKDGCDMWLAKGVKRDISEEFAKKMAYLARRFPDGLGPCKQLSGMIIRMYKDHYRSLSTKKRHMKTRPVSVHMYQMKRINAYIRACKEDDANE